MGKNNGFNLLELMVVMAVIAILASIAFPSYQRYMIKTHKSAAQQALMQIASRAEEYRLDARKYPAGLGSEADKLDFTVPDNVTPYYDVTLTSDNTATPPGFTVTATPKSGTVQADENVMKINHLGVKTGWEN